MNGLTCPLESSSNSETSSPFEEHKDLKMVPILSHGMSLTQKATEPLCVSQPLSVRALQVREAVSAPSFYESLQELSSLADLRLSKLASTSPVDEAALLETNP